MAKSYEEAIQKKKKRILNKEKFIFTSQRERQIKTTVKYYLTLLKLATIKKFDRSSLVVQWIKDPVFSLLWLWL